MSNKKFLLGIALILGCFRLLLIPVGTGDLAIWIADGQEILKSFSLPHKDLYSVHSNLDFIYPARLSNIFFAGIYNISEQIIHVAIFIRLFLFFSMIIFFKETLMGKIEWNIRNLIVASLALLGLTLFLDRAACLGLSLFLIIIHILNRDLSKKDFLSLFALFVFWSNLHSSVLILAPLLVYRIMLALYKKTSLLPHIILIGLYGVSLFVTPEHINILSYVKQTMSLSGQRVISEWTSALRFKHPMMSALYFLGLFLMLYKVCKSGRWKDLIFNQYFVFVFLGFVSIRHSVWFFAVLPLLYHQLNLWDKKPTYAFQNEKLNLGITLVLCLFCLINSPFLKSGNEQKVYGSDTPVAIANLLYRSEYKHRVFNQWELGSYLILKQPHPIFVDTRNIIYPQKIYEKYKKIINCTQSCEKLFKEFHLDTIVLRKEGWPLLTWIRKKTKIQYEDETFIMAKLEKTLKNI